VGKEKIYAKQHVLVVVQQSLGVIMVEKRRGSQRKALGSLAQGLGCALISKVMVPHFALVLSYLRVLNVGSGMVQKRNLARLLVGDGKGVL
jgi:hypothetical protein